MKTTFDACRLPSFSSGLSIAPAAFVWETISVSESVAVRYPAWPGDAAEGLLGALREAGARLADVPVEDLVMAPVAIWSAVVVVGRGRSPGVGQGCFLFALAWASAVR